MLPTEDPSSNDNNEHQIEQEFKFHGYESDFNHVTPPNRIEWNNSNSNSNNLSNYQSRTDKPRLAYEIYARLIENAIRDQVMAATMTNSTPLFNNTALLNAAYTGCKLIYRN